MEKDNGEMEEREQRVMGSEYKSKRGKGAGCRGRGGRE